MRDSIVIGLACVVAIVIGAWLFMSAGAPSEAPASGPVSFSVLVEGQDSGAITEQKNYRIRTASELQELWRLVYGTDGPTIPKVDFDQNEVLAVFDGTHSSGGYDVDVVDVNDENGLIRHVSILHLAPGETCMTSSAVTSPFQIILLSKSALSIAREDRTEARSCE